MTRGYSDTVETWFWRPARPMGGYIRGAAGTTQGGIRIEFAADVAAGRLDKLGFRALACPHIIAACNWLAERLQGRQVEALLDIPMDELRTEFDIPVEKAGKLLILQDAARACYADYQARRATSDV